MQAAGIQRLRPSTCWCPKQDRNEQHVIFQRHLLHDFCCCINTADASRRSDQLDCNAAATEPLQDLPSTFHPAVRCVQVSLSCPCLLLYCACCGSPQPHLEGAPENAHRPSSPTCILSCLMNDCLLHLFVATRILTWSVLLRVHTCPHHPPTRHSYRHNRQNTAQSTVQHK